MIKLDKQEKRVWLATTDGWNRVIGNIVNIDGIELSIVPHKESDMETQIARFPYGTSFLFSELESGAKLAEVPVNLFDFINADTKEKTMAMFYEESKRVQKAIEYYGVEKIKEKSKQALDEMVDKFGERPAIEDCFELEEGL